MFSSQDHALEPNFGGFQLILDQMVEAKSASPESLVRQHAALLAFGRWASSLPDLGVLMQDAVALAAEALDADLGGMAEVTGGRELVLTVAATDKRGKLVHPTSHTYPLTTEACMAAYVVNMACPVVCADLAAESRFGDLLLRKLGVVSGLCVPLHLGNEVFGTLGVYATRPREFLDDDLHFLETIAHLLTSAITRTRAKSQLLQHQDLASAVLDMVDALVLTLDPQGCVLDLNRACERITGFSLAAVRGKLLEQFFIAPEEVDLVRGILQTCTSGVRPCEFESSLLTRDGQRRRAVWSLKVISGDQGPRLLLVGSDRTEQLQIEVELQRVRLAAERAEKAAAELRANAAVPTLSTRDAAMAEQCLAQDAAARRMAAPADAPTPSKGGQELRSSPRREFRYFQLIAPLVGKRLPARKDFFAVEFRDISAGGISFYLDQRPDFEYLVVVLGRAPEENYFAAQVVRVVNEELDGRQRILVGCRFTGRVQIT